MRSKIKHTLDFFFLDAKESKESKESISLWFWLSKLTRRCENTLKFVDL